MIEISNLTFQYKEGAEPTVADINLTIPDGQFVGITGAAGSGKSTMTYLFNGIVPHCYPGDFYGSVVVNGCDTIDTSLTDLSRMVGSVCQDIDSQMISSVVEDEMLYGLENFGVPHDEIFARMDEALDIVGITDLKDRNIASLSGGQKQKVAVAAILALKPQVLVLDEPTAELDPASSQNIFDLLSRYAREHGITVIVVEQKIALLSNYADRLIIMKDGRIFMDGAPSEVLEHVDELLEVGVNCPRSTSLAHNLSKSGLYAGAACRNVADAVAAVEGVLA